MALLPLPALLNDHLPQKQGLRHFFIKSILRKYYAQWPSSTKTRIKTKLKCFVTLSTLKLNDHLPQKQGLRHDKKVSANTRFVKSQWPSSTKTRIKTLFPCCWQCDILWSQWPSSTKTRIKTFPQMFWGVLVLFSMTIFHKNKD